MPLTFVYYVTMVIVSNVSKIILQWSIYNQITFTNQQNGATLAHNNLISVQCMYYGVLVYIVTIIEDLYPL
jgi:hypothetical protein